LRVESSSIAVFGKLKHSENEKWFLVKTSAKKSFSFIEMNASASAKVFYPL